MHVFGKNEKLTFCLPAVSFFYITRFYLIYRPYVKICCLYLYKYIVYILKQNILVLLWKLYKFIVEKSRKYRNTKIANSVTDSPTTFWKPVLSFWGKYFYSLLSAFNFTDIYNVLFILYIMNSSIFYNWNISILLT